jgi:colanic acid/amylovoran biosynthesis glycosyltransferase
MEAMYIGLPVISTAHSAIPELIENKITGFLVPERDIEALTVAIDDLISNPEKWFDITYNARKKIEKEYCLSKQNKILYEMFANLCLT